jgi:hypothetical protein
VKLRLFIIIINGRLENYYRLFLQRGGGHFVTSAKQFFALKKMAKKNGWIERVPRLSPTASFTCSSAWRIRNVINADTEISNTLPHDLTLAN